MYLLLSIIQGLFQRPQPTQIIWVCPDIWVFSVLHNRHLSDIWVIYQKCQFEVRKGWQVPYRSLNKRLRTFFVNKQTLPHSFWMHGLYAKCSVSGILRIVTYPSCNWTNTRDLSQIGFLSRIRGFCVCFVQTFTQTFRIWLRFCADIWTKNWRLRPLPSIQSHPL